jgi:beta-xylosidase
MKKYLFILILAAIILSACGTSDNVQAPTNPPAAPATVPPATMVVASSKSTPGPVVFQDDFNGVMDGKWQWTRENKKDWSLTDSAGWLEIMAGSGSVGAGDISNLLMRQAPAGNFELETKLKFKPTANNQFAGLIIYESDKSFVLFGQGFCDDAKCVGDGYYMDTVSGGSSIPENSSAKASTNDMVTLRLQREGNLFTAFVSENGEEWKVIETINNSLLPLYVGLVAGQGKNTTPIPAQFDSFVINALP